MTIADDLYVLERRKIEYIDLRYSTPLREYMAAVAMKYIIDKTAGKEVDTSKIDMILSVYEWVEEVLDYFEEMRKHISSGASFTRAEINFSHLDKLDPKITFEMLRS